MSNQLNIMIVDSDQQYFDAIMAELQHLDCHVTYVEDKEDFNHKLKHNVIDCIVLSHAVDFDYRYTLTQLRILKLTTPVVLLVNDVNTLGDTDPNSLLTQAFRSGISDAVYAKNYVHLAAILTKTNRMTALERELTIIKQTMQEVAKREEDLLEKAVSAVCFIQDGMHVFVNEHYASLFGYHAAEDLIGVPFIDLVDSAHTSTVKQYLKAFAKENYSTDHLDCVSHDANGKSFESYMRFTPADYEGERCTQVVVTNLSQSVSHTRTLQRVVGLDPQTNMGNRLALKARLNELYSSDQKQATSVMVFSSDSTTQFDTLKLSERSELTSQFAELLTTSFTSEEVFRFGDTYFAVLSTQATTDELTSNANAFKTLIASKTFVINQNHLQTTLSIGVCSYYPSMLSSEDWLENAFDCAKQAHLAGGDRIVIFAPKTAQQHDTEANESNAILDAIRNNQFVLKFQHVYNTFDESEQIFEVFLRLQLSDGSIVKPEFFLETAKTCGLNDSLDKWVMMNACKQLKIYQQEYPSSKMIINLTEFALQNIANVELIKKLLSVLGQPFAASVIFQFSESSIMQYLKTAIPTLQTIKSLGSNISISSFGASINAFGIFDHVPCDVVKLDKSLVQDWSEGESIEKLKDIVAEVTALNKKTIIPFIDNPTSMAKAWTVGAQFLQGYFLHSPSDSMLPHIEH